MTASWVDRLLGRLTPHTMRPRLAEPAMPAAIYAVGDVHGHLDLLVALEHAILHDAQTIDGEKWIVMLGDYIDRGPQSAGVMARMLAPMPRGWRRICLCGNHEDVMTAALSNAEAFNIWLELGGWATLSSYGAVPGLIKLAADNWGEYIARIRSNIPRAHRAFVANLPVLLTVPGFVFVHAGLRPDVDIARQSEDDLLWIRDDFLHAETDFGAIVVHGHTPVDQPFISLNRINVDTGAFHSGVLTAIRLTRGERPVTLQVVNRK